MLYDAVYSVFFQVEVSNTEELTLSNVCVNVGNNKRNNFTVMDKDGCPPIKVPVSCSIKLIKNMPLCVWVCMKQTTYSNLPAVFKNNMNMENKIVV